MFPPPSPLLCLGATGTSVGILSRVLTGPHSETGENSLVLLTGGEKSSHLKTYPVHKNFYLVRPALNGNYCTRAQLTRLLPGSNQPGLGVENPTAAPLEALVKVTAQGTAH